MSAEAVTDKNVAVQEYINHHVLSSGPEWTPLGKAFTVHLPEWLPVHGLMVLFGAVILLLLFLLGYKRKAAVPTGLHNVLELFVVFVRDQIAVPNMGEADGKKLTPLLCTFFFFILTLNLLGLVPAFVSATGNVNVTAALATVTLGFMIVGTMAKNGVGGFFKSFVPHGIPWPVLILLVPIEFAGMFIKAFALMIRLFANMMAGHIVILALLSLAVTMSIWAAAAAVPLALGIYLLEVFVAFLQAYVFTLLSAMFIGQMYHPAH